MRRRTRIAFLTLFFVLAVNQDTSAQGRSNAQLAWRDCMARDIATAVRGCTTIIESKGTRPRDLARAYLARGKALGKRGQTRDAIADFDYVIEVRPGNAEAYVERGRAYWSRSERKRAQDDLDAAIRLKPEPFRLSLRGWFFKDYEADRANADFERAITAANAAIRRNQTNAEAHHAKGEALAGKGEYQEAIAEYDRAIRLKPDAEEFYLNRGIVHSLKGESERALADIGEAIRLQPDYSSAYYQRGDLNLQKAPDAALADSEKMIALAADDPRGFNGRGAAYRFKKDFDRALTDINEALRLSPNYVSAYSNRGWTYLNKGEDDRAVLDFSRALNMNAKHVGALDGRALAYFRLEDYRKSLADRDAVVSLAPSAASFRARAGVHQVMHNKQAAIADRNEVVRMAPDDLKSYAERASTYDWFHEEARALADYNRVVQLRPNEANSYRLRAEHHAKARAFDLAIADADAAVRMEPTIDSYLLRSSVYLKARQHDKALEDANEALRLAPASLKVFEARAGLFQARGEDDMALADFDTMVRLEPGNADAFHARGTHLLFRQNKYDRAIADFSEAIRLAPDDAGHYAQRARAYQLKGEGNKALADYERAERIRPTLEAGSTAAAYEMLGDLDRALAAANEGVKIKPGSATSYIQRAEVYIKKKQYDKALTDLSEALRLAPNGPEAAVAYANRAVILNRREDYQRELADWDKVIEIYHDAGGYRSGRALTRLLVGDTEGAIADADEVVRARPVGLSYMNRCGIYIQLKQWDAALKDCDEALRQEPLNGTFISGRARVLLELGRTEEALTAAELALRVSGNRAGALRVHGLVLAALGRHVEAIDDFSSSIQLDDDATAGTYARRAASYEALGMRTQALADYRKATELEVTTPSERELRIRARQKVAELEALIAAAPASTATLPKEAAKPIAMGRRIALVIGIGAYEAITPLPNPSNDAKAMAAVFRRLGFAEVMELANPSRARLEEAVKNFGDKAAEADWAVVFYAGHGMQIDGRNFLIPADATLGRASHVEYETVPLDRVMGSASEAKKLGLVILDACRNNPFLQRMRQDGRSSRAIGVGLARVEPKRGELVAFATRDGHLAADGAGADSPFTEGMLEHIEEPDIDIRLFFSKVRDTVLAKTRNEQEPFTYHSLPGEGLFFKMSAQ